MSESEIAKILKILVKEETERLLAERKQNEDFWSRKYGKLAVLLPLLAEVVAASPAELVTSTHNELMGFVQLTFDDLRWSKQRYKIEPGVQPSTGEDGYTIERIVSSRDNHYKEPFQWFAKPEQVIEYCVREMAIFIVRTKNAHDVL